MDAESAEEDAEDSRDDLRLLGVAGGSRGRAVRALGPVGAGGIGYALTMSMRLCQYGRLLMICAGVYLLVTLIDRVSWRLRSRVI